VFDHRLVYVGFAMYKAVKVKRLSTPACTDTEVLYRPYGP